MYVQNHVQKTEGFCTLQDDIETMFCESHLMLHTVSFYLFAAFKNQIFL